ncbi:MAG: hypothetical protein M3024_12620 [Candidatus Dormibacteraeota bacterium]|nr:hypothetical protein [Candidatus Dormibacteraeota bacterium]
MSPREIDRLLELGVDMGSRVTHALRDVVPPEAQAHLLNAQRELLTAVFLIYEQQVGGRRPPPAAERLTAKAAPPARRSRSKPRSGRIPID